MRLFGAPVMGDSKVATNAEHGKELSSVCPSSCAVGAVLLLLLLVLA